jgi:putative glutathione S-transferase
VGVTDNLKHQALLLWFRPEPCREVYDKLSPGYRGRCTAPLLIDKKAMRAVSNESSDIVRMLGQLQLPGASGVDLYPQQLQQQIDQLNDKVSIT